VARIWYLAAVIIPFFSLLESPSGSAKVFHFFLLLLPVSVVMLVIISIRKRYFMHELIKKYGVSVILGTVFSYLACKTTLDNVHNYILGIIAITLFRGMLYFGKYRALLAVTLINLCIATLMLSFLRNESLFEIPNLASTLFFSIIFMLLSFVGMHTRYRLTRENFISSVKLQLSFDEIGEKNKSITDSINYAKRLQLAILPTAQALHEHIPESFILYRPKDIVAGDFYWMQHIEGTTFIAAGDSTGHGVPGALVSIVCSNAMNRAVKEFGMRETGQLLDKTRDLVLETFAKSNSDVKDGMDVSLLSINRQRGEIRWSGANNALIYLSNGELREIKADKQPIGKTDNPKPFTTHKLGLDEVQQIWLLTDGYADQFGGEDGKKFKHKRLSAELLAISDLSLDRQGELLEATFDSWRGKLEQVDDVTIIGLRI